MGAPLTGIHLLAVGKVLHVQNPVGTASTVNCLHLEAGERSYCVRALSTIGGVPDVDQ
jgi:hypothetical protein